MRIEHTKTCTPADEAKLRGTAQFMAHAAALKVGGAGIGPFKQRRREGVHPWDASKRMLEAVECLVALLGPWPKRRINLKLAKLPPLVIASGAQADPGL